MTKPDVLERLQAAQRLIRDERYAEVLTTLADLDELDGGGAVLAMRSAARGFDLAAQGRTQAAMPLMEEALAAGAFLPELLAALAGFFTRHERPMLAQHAFLLAETLAPRSMAPFVDALPESERARYAPWMLTASDAARLGDVQALAPAKRALVDRLGSDGAAATLAAMLTPPGRGIAKRNRLTPLHEHAEAFGTDFRVLIPGGPTPSATVRVFEGDSQPATRRAARRVFTAMLEDVVVSSRSNFLLTGDLVLLDATPSEIQQRPGDFSVDPLIAAGGAEELIVVEHADRGSLGAVPEAISLCGTHTGSFGHWVRESLPRLGALMDVRGFDEIPVLVDIRIPKRQRDSLRLLLGGDHPLIDVRQGQSVFVEKLWVSSAPVYLPIGPGTYQPDRLRTGFGDGYRDLVDRFTRRLSAVEPTDTPARLYLTSRNRDRPSLTNANAIAVVLADHGFVAVDTDALPFDEQLRLIRGAQHVVAQSPSVSLMCTFAQRGLQLAILSPPALNDVGPMAQACHVLGIDLVAITGDVASEDEHHRWLSDYSIDPDQLARYLGASPETVADST